MYLKQLWGALLHIRVVVITERKARGSTVHNILIAGRPAVVEFHPVISRNHLTLTTITGVTLHKVTRSNFVRPSLDNDWTR